jgi:sugar phosphate isomerase/epimerase
LAHLSLISLPPVGQIRIAGEAGFDLVDLRLSPATPTNTSYAKDERLRLCRQLVPLLRDMGLKVWDVEIIRLNDRTDPREHLSLMEAAAVLGASRIKLVCDSGDHARAAEMLGRLAELAVPFGLTLDLEYMVFSGVHSLASALRLGAAADQPNLKILVDALHWRRAGDMAASLRAGGPLGYVQLCDGPPKRRLDQEALIHERGPGGLPGEGGRSTRRWSHAAQLCRQPRGALAARPRPLARGGSRPWRALADHMSGDSVKPRASPSWAQAWSGAGTPRYLSLPQVVELAAVADPAADPPRLNWVARTGSSTKKKCWTGPGRKPSHRHA